MIRYFVVPSVLTMAIVITVTTLSVYCFLELPLLPLHQMLRWDVQNGLGGWNDVCCEEMAMLMMAALHFM